MTAFNPSRATRAASWLTFLAVLCAAMFVLTYEVAVHTTRGRLLDGASLRGAVDSRSSVTIAIERLLDVVSVASLLGAVIVIALIALVRLRRELALGAVVVLLGANGSSQVLKRFVLERPDLGLYESTPSTLNSMPSGHSTVAFSVAVALVMVLPVRLRAAVAGFGVLYASVAAVATLSAGWHRPSDSLAAFFVVGFWASLVGAALIAHHRSDEVAATSDSADADAAGLVDPNPGPHRRTVRRLASAAAYLLAFGGLLSGIVVTTQLDTYGTAAQVLAYGAGAAAIAGTAAALMGALLAFMHRIAPRVTTPADDEDEAAEAAAATN